MALSTGHAASSPGIKKVGDMTIYADPQFHTAFPSVVRRPDGELLVMFRRAPDRRLLGDPGYTHTDSNSYLVMVRSRDDGRTWTKEPQLVFAHPFGGSQDPCMVQLSDNSLLVSSYGWSWFPPEALPKLPQPHTLHSGKFVFLGGWLLRSTDGGASWQKPIIPPRSEGETRVDIHGKPLPAYNRGAMYETPKGDLIAFMRTAKLDDHLVVARSRDHGKTFEKWEDIAFQGHPYHALRLPDGRALLVYGYRHKPYGIRARVLDPECTNIAAAPEVILRDDGGHIDLGYPWSTMIGKDRALVTYYFNKADGPRTIEGTIVQID